MAQLPTPTCSKSGRNDTDSHRDRFAAVLGQGSASTRPHAELGKFVQVDLPSIVATVCSCGVSIVVMVMHKQINKLIRATPCRFARGGDG
eukprot:13039293-Alexandrium_andersonii.AAC.1